MPATQQKTLTIDRRFVRNLISRLDRYCFYAGTEKYMAAKGVTELTPEYMEHLSPEERDEYSRYATWSFRKAQAVIIKTRLKIEDAIAAKAVTCKAPYTAEYILKLLTDFADCLGWILLNHDISAARNFVLEVKKQSPLRAQNWESVEAVMAHYHKDQYQFALATDLTSFMHVGDLYVTNAKKHEGYSVEIKSGKHNEKILKMLTSKNPALFKQQAAELLQDSQNPHHTAKQIERAFRQVRRSMTSLDYAGSGGKNRTELKDEKKVNIFEEHRAETKWSTQVNEVLKDMPDGEVSRGWVDYCLFFGYGKKPLTYLDDLAFRFDVVQHYGLNLTAKESMQLPVFNVGRMLAQPGIPPRSLNLFMLLGETRQSKLLSLDEHLLVYLHIPGVKHLLEEEGLGFYTRNMKDNEQQYADGLMRSLFGPNKIPVITKKTKERNFSWSILTGTWQRVLFDFMAPVELANYSHTIADAPSRAGK